ncbi:MAG: DedA family protein [Chloroflexi bacterium]|nr:DedA family protein [Chloroflexota bacterium]
MNILTDLLDLFLHLDEHLTVVTQTYGSLTYFFLFLVIFMETGLVITPFLPGDSLLFAAGALAALPGTGLNVGLLFLLLFVAAVIGDTVNYWIGKAIGPRVFEQNYRFLKREYLERTQAFYAKHGGKTIILARFVPIVRTFAPFVAGVGTMSYRQFILFNIIGGLLWTLLFIFGGYFFGNIPIVKENFEFVILGIIFISVLPMFIEWYRGRKQAPASSTQS